MSAKSKARSAAIPAWSQPDYREEAETTAVALWSEPDYREAPNAAAASHHHQDAGGQDWICPNCDNDNWARRLACKQCDAKRPGLGRETYWEKRKAPALEDTSSWKGGDWNCGRCDAHNFASRRECYKCNAASPSAALDRHASDRHEGKEKNWKGGDWRCLQCDAHNFASRRDCFKCKAASPTADAEGRGGHEDRVVKPWKGGDWRCGECDAHNFASRQNCFKCQAAMGDAEDEDRQDRPWKEKDWLCGECHGHNYASRNDCFKCKSPAPPGEGGVEKVLGFKGGDWLCPKCSNHNFAKRDTCHRCKESAPPETHRFKNVIEPAKRADAASFKNGDWLCHCGNHNFAFRGECKRCGMNRLCCVSADAWTPASVPASKVPNASNKPGVSRAVCPSAPGRPTVLASVPIVAPPFMPPVDGSTAQSSQALANPTGSVYQPSQPSQGESLWTCPNCGFNNSGVNACQCCQMTFQAPQQQQLQQMSFQAPPQVARYKSQLCRHFMGQGWCANHQGCTFAHGEQELQVPMPKRQKQEEVQSDALLRAVAQATAFFAQRGL